MTPRFHPLQYPTEKGGRSAPPAGASLLKAQDLRAWGHMWTSPFTHHEAPQHTMIELRAGLRKCLATPYTRRPRTPEARLWLTTWTPQACWDPYVACPSDKQTDFSNEHRDFSTPITCSSTPQNAMRCKLARSAHIQPPHKAKHVHPLTLQLTATACPSVNMSSAMRHDWSGSKKPLQPKSALQANCHGRSTCAPSAFTA